MLILANGQVASTTTAILSPNGSTPNPMPIGFDGGRCEVSFYNNTAVAQNIVLTQKISGSSTSRHLYTINGLAQNQKAVVSGLMVGKGDTLLAITTTASQVDYIISDNSSLEEKVTVYNASGQPLSPTSTTIPLSQFATGTTTGTFTAGQLTGAANTFYSNTGASPGSIATRTATQMFADFTGATAGLAYTLIVTNAQNTGTLTITAGSGVTLTGTMTIPPNTSREFVVTFNSATTATIQNIGVAPSVALLPPAQFTSINVTTGTLAASVASGGAFTSVTSTNATPGSQAMRTPAQVLTDTAGLVVGMAYMLRITNTGAGTFTLATDSGAGFTMTGNMTIPVNTYRDFVVTINTATTGTVQSVASGPASQQLPPAQFSTINVTTGTLAAGNASGAAYTELTSTNATPGAQAMRTVAQVLTDSPALSVGQSYVLRVRNNGGTSAFTLATDSGAQFTMTGTMTVLPNSFRDFLVTINTATTGTVQDIGSPADLLTTQTVVYSATIALVVPAAPIAKVLIPGVNGTAAAFTLNCAAVAPAGQMLVVETTADGSGTVTGTFGTHFRTTGTQATTLSKISEMIFVGDGTNWNEIARNTAMT